MNASRRSWIAALLLSASTGLAIGVFVDVGAPPSTAATVMGTEDAFAPSGLHEREMGPTPIRWTGERARLRFRHLPPGRAGVVVEVRGHRDWVAVSTNGAAQGTLAPGSSTGVFGADVPPGGALDVDLHVRGFEAGGRLLGTQLGSVQIAPPQERGVDGRVLAAFAVPAVAAALAMLAAGWGVLGAWLASLGIAAAEAALLFPSGIVHSGYTDRLAIGLTLGTLIALGLARLAERFWAGAARGALVAALVALIVQGAAATWPAMMTSDVVMNAHYLRDVSRGNWSITSRTQHKPPFQIPYGVSFYAVLLPFERAGFDRVDVVRAGAAAAGLLATIGVFVIVAPRSPAAAAAAVLALQLLPGTFVRYSYGNLANVFGQAMTVLFFAWWTREGRGGAGLGALLMILAGLGHLSAAIVLAALLLALLVVRRGWGGLPRAAQTAVLVAGAVIVGYYAQVLVESGAWMQIPRLLEGPGSGGAASRSLLAVVQKQLNDVFWEWGLPALALAWAGRPRERRGLDGDLLAFWLAGAGLGLLALVSPVEVRYLYALTAPLAVAVGQGTLALLRSPGPERFSGLALLLAQIAFALTRLHYDLYSRYRP